MYSKQNNSHKSTKTTGFYDYENEIGPNKGNNVFQLKILVANYPSDQMPILEH